MRNEAERTENSTDVLIVGAGPVGLSMGIELRRRGIDCRLVERNDGTVKTSRALVINPRTLQAFDDMGVLEPVLAEGIRVTEQRAYVDGQELFRLDMEHVNTPYPYEWFLPQNRTERHLLDRFEALGGEVEFERELVGFDRDADGVTATIAHVDKTEQSGTVRARWLVGCDGSRSRVRKTLGLDLKGGSFTSSWLVADAYVDWRYPDDAIGAYFHEDGVVGALPMDDEGLWRLFIEVETNPDADPDTSAEAFQWLLRQRTGDPMATVRETTWTSVFRVNQQMVDSYRRGRVFIAGDAAHVHSPLGGLGMNTGIQDAYNLGWKLAAVINGTAQPELLDSYEAERLPVASEVLRMTGLSSRALLSGSALFGGSHSNRLVRLLGDVVLSRAFESRWLTQRFLRGNTQLDIEYCNSLLSDDHVETSMASLRRSLLCRRAPKAGDLSPNGICRRADGTETSIYDELHGQTGFVLLVFTGFEKNSGDDPAGVIQTVADDVGEIVRPYLVVPNADTIPDFGEEVSILVDRNGQLRELYDVAEPSLYLIRPDDYIGFSSRPIRTEPLVEYLDDWFHVTALDQTYSARSSMGVLQ